MLPLGWTLWFCVVLPSLSLADATFDPQSSRRSSAYQLTGQVRRPMVRTLVPQCTVPYFPYGEAKIRNRGRMVRFDCSHGYKLVGNRYTNCNNGRWDTSIPVCVKPGCETIPKVDSGYVLYEMSKATAWLSCFDGTELAGSKNTYCNGTHWDRPLGVCRTTGQGTPTFCDFEAESLCGWTNDVLHDFDWKRSDGTLNPRALRTGPKYDHTTMQPKAGHFIIVDSAEQFTNETARFISPMYEPDLSVGACFQFYYHMYGEMVGSLKVYVKPMSSDLYDLKPTLVLEGNKKNIWHEGNIPVAEQTERFQIVFEASLGNRYKSDIAIDDVSLVRGDSCKIAVEDGLDNPDEPPTDPERVPVKIDSCENRCGVSMMSVLNNTDTIVHCDCHEDCVINATCCPDFRERCVFEVIPDVNASISSTTPVTTTTTTSTITSTSTSVPVSTSTATTMSSTSTVAPTTASTTTSTTTTTTSRPSTVRSTSTTPRKLPSTISTSSTTKRYNLRPLPYVPMTNRPRMPPSTTTARPVTTTMSSTKSTTASTSTVAVRSSTTEVTMRRSSSTAEPTQSDMVDEMAVYRTSTTSNVEQLLLGGLVHESIPPASAPSRMKLFVYITAGAVAFLSILWITYSYARRSRSSVLSRLKEKSQKNRFDDIRFLADEENLDFNISLGNEATEEEKGAVEPEGSQTIADDVQASTNHTAGAVGKQVTQDAGHGAETRKSQQPGGTTVSASGHRHNGAVDDADDGGSNSSTDEEPHGGSSGDVLSTKRKSTKKAYHKYVKHCDDDMVSTLL